MSLHIRTPLVQSQGLSQHAGHEVWLKFESAQPSASFKLRGMGRIAEKALEEGAERLITSSGGNAGLAVAYAGRQLRMPVVVVVPRRTSALMRDRIAAEGAEVLVHGEVWDDAHAHAIALAEEGGFLVHPFDHPYVWEGNASLIHEVHGAMPKPGSILVSVGGGGLLLGVLQGLRDVGWDDVPVLAVETHGAASLGAAMKAGELVTLPDIASVALTLGAKTVASEALRQGLAHPVTPIQVTDTAAVTAVERFLDDHRVLVEPACGASLSLLYDRHAALQGPVLAVVCGGAAATLDALAGWRKDARD
ncbi:MAG: pyridoxal-phosphate dependent enzyme [Deltaproteobacteria bacterium]|nr:MAG: pyridoxal-phosphate dependent enzyme [Deltaproteobacteria bacterium]